MPWVQPGNVPDCSGEATRAASARYRGVVASLLDWLTVQRCTRQPVTSAHGLPAVQARCNSPIGGDMHGDCTGSLLTGDGLRAKRKPTVRTALRALSLPGIALPDGQHSVPVAGRCIVHIGCGDVGCTVAVAAVCRRERSPCPLPV